MKAKAMNQAEILEKYIRKNILYEVLLMAQNAESLEKLISQIQSKIEG